MSILYDLMKPMINDMPMMTSHLQNYFEKPPIKTKIFFYILKIFENSKYLRIDSEFTK